ncbi:MAG: sulfur carrier protein ThiS [Desulfobacula sp.]|nr:sulfur carrier protein ThiS [Desulfobacula sp.]
MKINLNGKRVESKSKTLMDLVLEQGFDLTSLIIEINFEVIKQETWQDISIKEGDNVELLSFVGGG